MIAKNKKEVIIVHAVDTEGPLHESLNAKFDRLQDLFEINSIERTHANFKKLQRGEINLGGIEKKVQEVLSGHLVTYNDTWDKIDSMLDELMSDEFRYSLPDSFGGGWKFTWHCLDHIGFDYNPRRRDIGYHNIFDHYKEWLERKPQYGDELQWHFHPTSTYADAHRCATFYFRNDLAYQILCRKIIERNWFPSAFRAGFQAERPDSHWFLEQWFPFDITNMAVDDPEHFDSTIDFRNGRSGDWRRAPSDWSIYHPNHDDYQLAGSCRRWIGRALNVMNRLASIDIYETEKAFSKADEEDAPVLMGVTGHDFRNLAAEVNHVRDLVRQVSRKYPSVNFRYCTMKEGFRRVIWGDGPYGPPLELEGKLFEQPSDDVPHLIVTTKSGSVFGPQPFLAIQTRSRRFLYDNFDFISKNRWGYAFHGDTLPFSDVLNISIAANDEFGNTSIVKVL